MIMTDYHETFLHTNRSMCGVTFWVAKLWPYRKKYHAKVQTPDGKEFHVLTHWGRVTHICVSKLSIIVSDNGLSSGRCRAIIWINAGIFVIGPLGTNFSEILFEIYISLFKEIHMKLSLGIWQLFCLGLNVLTCYRQMPQNHVTGCTNLHLTLNKKKWLLAVKFQTYRGSSQQKEVVLSI